MAKAIASGVKRRDGAMLRRSRSSRAGWVRKNLVMDQRKLDAARRALGAQTETETVDVALDFVAFRRELVRGIASIRRSGGIEDVFEV